MAGALFLIVSGFYAALFLCWRPASNCFWFLRCAVSMAGALFLIVSGFYAALFLWLAAQFLIVSGFYGWRRFRVSVAAPFESFDVWSNNFKPYQPETRNLETRNQKLYESHLSSPYQRYRLCAYPLLASLKTETFCCRCLNRHL